jgi:hypothetical protein
MPGTFPGEHAMHRSSATILLAAALVALPQIAAARIRPVGPQPTAAVLLLVDENPFARELSDFHRSIDDAQDRGQFTRKQARRYRTEARLIARLAARYARDGLTPDEYHELEFRTIVARQQADAMRGVTIGSPPPPPPPPPAPPAEAP